uniref:Uncharacterized protein n=1 Tax=Leptobrachium leishanense TaxID=445787 RepID=A0A8C5MH20_9ANUR
TRKMSLCVRLPHTGFGWSCRILDMYLAQAGLLELRRKEIQHKRWTDCVAEPLKKIIDGHIDGHSSEDLERKKQFLREQYEQYLKYCNIKGRVFLRDYDSSEYNPFLYQFCKKYLRVSTPPFRDPLLFQLQKRIEEEQITLRCETGRVYSAKDIRAFNLPRVPLGRQDINSKDWTKTPFGFIESEIRLKSRFNVKNVICLFF